MSTRERSFLRFNWMLWPSYRHQLGDGAGQGTPMGRACGRRAGSHKVGDVRTTTGHHGVPMRMTVVQGQ